MIHFFVAMVFMYTISPFWCAVYGLVTVAIWKPWKEL